MVACNVSLYISRTRGASFKLRNPLIRNQSTFQHLVILPKTQRGTRDHGMGTYPVLSWLPAKVRNRKCSILFDGFSQRGKASTILPRVSTMVDLLVKFLGLRGNLNLKSRRYHHISVRLINGQLLNNEPATYPAFPQRPDVGEIVKIFHILSR